jgi:hypothetical protein
MLILMLKRCAAGHFKISTAPSANEKESRSIVHFARTRDVNLHLPVTFPTSSLAA